MQNKCVRTLGVPVYVRILSQQGYRLDFGRILQKLVSWRGGKKFEHSAQARLGVFGISG